MKKFFAIIIIILSIFITLQIASPVAIAQGGATYYISPTGNDANSGTSEAQAWATFDRAWQDIYPGDTLVLLDGIYYQSLRPNKRNGTSDNPITIRAKNDGQAIIDGQYTRIPVQLGETWPGPIGNYFVIEGIVARNSSSSVYFIWGGQHNILRRVSGYNANTDDNNHVFSIWADNNLIEDCIAGGTGRKMIMIYEGQNNIIRRCIADWSSWDGRDFCGVSWPNGGNIHIYNADNNIVENSIAVGPVAKWSVLIQANDTSVQAVGNKILGSIAINAGMNSDGTVKDYGSRPQPTSCTDETDFDWPSHRVGFVLYGQGILQDNLFQDIFAWGNAGLGFTFHPGTSYNPQNNNNVLRRATIINNGLDNPEGPWGEYGGIGTDALLYELNHLDSIEDSQIGQILVDWPNYYNGGQRVTTSMNGNGAQLSYRYVDGVLTTQPLWPWPMDDRTQRELGYSVTEMMSPLVGEPGFTLNANSLSIDAGDNAVSTVHIQHYNQFTETVAVEIGNPTPSDLSVNSVPPPISINPPGGETTVNITDLHPASDESTYVYQIPITATGGEITRTMNILIFVNGKQVFLPLIFK